MGKSLKEYIGEIRAIPLDDRLSDDAVVALMDIHLSLMSMIVANGLEDTYGGAAAHRAAMEKLFALCSRRSAGNQSLERSSRMIPSMYSIFCMPDAVFDDRRHSACLNRSFRLAKAWREKTKGIPPTDEKARMTEYGVLQSILEAFLYVAGEDKAADEDYLYLKRRIEAWASALDPDGRWIGLSDEEAMNRLALMTGYSKAELDRRFDARIEKALGFYCDSITGHERIDGRTLFNLYRTSMSWAGYQDSPGTGTIVACAIRGLESAFAVDLDDRLWHMAVLIDRECADINSEMKQKVLAYSA